MRAGDALALFYLLKFIFFLMFSLSPIQRLLVAFSLLRPCDFSKFIKPSSVGEPCLPRYVSWAENPLTRERSLQME